MKATATLLLLFGAASLAAGADWRQFRGPGGQGVSSEKGLPVEWSATKNIAWKLKMPGAGASCPVIVGNRVFVTCYSGYGMDTKKPGNQKDLRRHLVCVDRAAGKIAWTKDFDPILPEHNYNGEGAYQGYAGNTPICDGERLYVFFGKSGVYCFDLDGKQEWHVQVGKGINGWGSGASPILYKNTLIVNASIEAGAIIALDKMTGKETWRTPGIREAWNTPVLVAMPTKEPELVVSTNDKVISIDPDSGKERWRANGVKRYCIPSIVAHDNTIFVLGGGSTSLAIKTGGRGDVTSTNTVWRETKGSNASSPIYHEGHLYWASESGGTIHCQEAATGKIVFAERLKGGEDRIWASPVLVDGRLYFVTQFKGAFVVAARPKFERLAHNVFSDDANRSNASLAVSDGQLFLRNDENLYCIGKR